MNTFSQHVPGFIGVDGVDVVEFETTDELLSIDCVKQWVKDIGGKPFSHFAISGNVLMVIHDGGFQKWAVGYISFPDAVDLPEWDGGKYRVMLDGERVVLLDKDVISICGDVLKLVDGREAYFYIGRLPSLE